MFYSRCSKNWSIPTSSELWFLQPEKTLFQKRNKSVNHAKWFKMLASVTVTTKRCITMNRNWIINNWIHFSSIQAAHCKKKDRILNFHIFYLPSNCICLSNDQKVEKKHKTDLQGWENELIMHFLQEGCKNTSSRGNSHSICGVGPCKQFKPNLMFSLSLILLNFFLRDLLLQQGNLG